MVQWICDRCLKKHQDLAARLSTVQDNWQALILTQVTDTDQSIQKIVHLCDHCSSLPNTAKISILSTENDNAMHNSTQGVCR